MAGAGNMRRFYDVEGEYVTIDELLSWVRDPDHRMPDGRCIPVCIWGGRGAGKCGRGDTSVVVNGRISTLADIFDAYADTDEAISDGDGSWYRPTEPLLVPSLDEHGQMVNRPVARLYRQRVREMGRRVVLSDGSTITMTEAHRLRGTEGWQREITAGDMVAVPATIPWGGEAVDDDLTTLLAWQISEGNELDDRAVCSITQKNRTTLERVRECAVRWAEREGLKINRSNIRTHSSGRAEVLHICSVAYRDWLRAHGYRWGAKSAQKRVPDFIVGADDRTVRRFLAEFFAAEAHVAHHEVELTLASEFMMKQIQLMLRRFGILFQLRVKRGRATNGAKIYRDYWRGRISGNSLRRFAEQVGFSDPVKQAKLEAISRGETNTNVEVVPVSDLVREIYQVSRLPQRILGIKPSLFRGRKEIGRDRLAPLMSACESVISKSVEVPRTSAKDSWSVVGKRRLEDLYEDTTRFRRFCELFALLKERAGLDVFWLRVKGVEPVYLDEYVFDFEVEETHNYVASMICTHNTAQVKAFCEKHGLQIKVYHPAHDKDGQDIVGTPVVDEETGEVTYALPEWLPKDDGSEGVWFIDEINRATEEVLAGLMEPLGEGTISQSGWVLPRGWQIVVAANPSETGYEVQELDDAMIDRLLHYNPGWEATTWAKWALGAGISPDIVDFALRRPEKLATHSSINLGTFQLPKEIEDALAATPRSLTYFAALYTPDMPERILRVVGQGLIGRDATDSFIEMRAVEGRPLPGSLIISEPTLDPRDPNNHIYVYDEYVRACEANPIEGTELLHASVEHLVVELIDRELPRIVVDAEGRWRPANSGDAPEVTQPAPSDDQNRVAQLAGRFLAFLPSENRDEAFQLIARSAPHWHDQLRESTGKWLENLATHAIVGQPSLPAGPVVGQPIGELGAGLGGIEDFPDALA